MTKHPPTPEQQLIIDATTAGHNTFVDAFAGCSKTTTLEMLAPTLPHKSVMALAFNVKNKKDLETRFPSNFEIKTLNGLGHVAWGRACGKRLVLDDRKLGKLVTEVAKEAGVTLSSDQWADLRTLVTKAKQAGLVPSNYPHSSLLPDTLTSWQTLIDDNFLLFDKPSEAAALAQSILRASVQRSFDGIIDFDDQIYMSSMFGGVFPRFPCVLVDEYQDLSPLNWRMVRKTAAGQLIVVGDSNQAIYGFRGADANAKKTAKALRTDWTELTLSVTFRCPSAVVARQQNHVPGYKAWHANKPGQVLRLPAGASETLPAEIPQEPRSQTWDWSDVPTAGETFVLCRNTAPLMKLAFKLIRKRIACHMLGRDIGKGLESLTKKIIPDLSTPVEACVRLITSWAQDRINLAMANDREDKVSTITDRTECLMAVIETAPNVKTAQDLLDALADLFDRSNTRITLSTIHRAKGMEADTVLHLDPWRVPSKWAKKAEAAGDPAQMVQEKNIIYVCETRTKDILVLANLGDFKE